MGRMALKLGSTAVHAILMMFAGWIHREQEAIVAYQKEEIRTFGGIADRRPEKPNRISSDE